MKKSLKVKISGNKVLQKSQKSKTQDFLPSDILSQDFRKLGFFTKVFLSSFFPETVVFLHRFKLYLLIYTYIYLYTYLFLLQVFGKCSSNQLRINTQKPEMEFKEFKPRFKFAKTRFKLSAGLNLKTFDIILSGTNHI